MASGTKFPFGNRKGFFIYNAKSITKGEIKWLN